MTYNVFGGTLNLAQLNLNVLSLSGEHATNDLRNWTTRCEVHMICMCSSWCQCHPIIY